MESKNENNETTTKKNRREKGTGSIYQLEDGRWVANFIIGTYENGRPKPKTFTGKTESEVKRKLNSFKKNTNNIQLENQSNVTLKKYINNWLYNYKINELKDLSFDRLETVVKKYIIPTLGNLQIKTIKQDDIQNLINDLYNDGKSYSSIKKVYDALNPCFKHAIIKEDILKNPMNGVKLPSKHKFTKKEIPFFTDEEIIKIKNELFRKYRTGNPVYIYADAYVLILNTGIRTAEALGLQWSDVNFEEKTIHIQRTVVYVKKRNENDITISKGKQIKIQDSVKTQSSNRIIDLNKSAFQAILRMKDNARNKTFIISNSNGNMVSPSDFLKTFYKILENAEVKKRGIHSLRHTFASNLFKKGADVKTVSEILGHSSISITYNTYIHLIQEQKKNVVNLLDE